MRRHLDFAKPTLWICPKCGTGVKTSENQPHGVGCTGLGRGCREGSAAPTLRRHCLLAKQPRLGRGWYEDKNCVLVRWATRADVWQVRR